MRPETFSIEAQVEETHWWFVGRRVLFAHEMSRLNIPTDAAILDIGTSTGTNLRLLKNLGYQNVMGLDSSDDAIRYCHTKGFEHVRKGDVRALPLGDESMDFILATDVLEHVDDDEAALREISRILKPGGHAIITVPAFELLWGPQDELALHKRRYRKRQLTERIANSGLTPNRAYYFNYILFVPILVARRLLRYLNVSLASESQVNTPLLNALLLAVFRFDIASAPYLSPPFGVSILAEASKN